MFYHKNVIKEKGENINRKDIYCTEFNGKLVAR
jgi:hypothetical protein